MIIIPKKGDLLNVPAGHIVHGCNAQGIMGSGVALAVKRKFPGAYLSYIHHHQEPQGLVLGVAYPFVVSDKLCIWNAITQEGFGLPTRNVSYDAIETCFGQINTYLEFTDDPMPKELHIPMIGAGLGGGNWEIIKTIIEQTVTYPTTVWML